jgi:hypothetical protein
MRRPLFTGLTTLPWVGANGSLVRTGRLLSLDHFILPPPPHHHTKYKAARDQQK